MEELDAYIKLLELGEPDLIEIKAVTYCGTSDASSLTMENVPWHHEVLDFAKAIGERTQGKYGLATEHAHSCCTLLARTDKYLVDGEWWTWIDYDKFQDLVQRYYESGGEATFTTEDYRAPTPRWAVYGAEERGFDPEENRYRKNRKGDTVEISYKSSESGCG